MTRIYLSPPSVGDNERAALLAAFDDGWIAPVGPDLNRFEHAVSERIGWPGCVALTSGTAGLHLALLGVGVRPGDRVFLSSFTFAATPNAVTYCGAEPVFIDSDTTSWNMCPDLLATALDEAARAGTLPAAVIVVDLYGQCADYDRINDLCRRYDVPVIEDAAEALGATYRDRAAGTLGDVGVFSFNGNKIITTSGGGMLVAPDAAFADRARYLATQARQPVVHYEHEDIGFNYRMSNLLAALGAAQFERLDEIIDRKLATNRHYRELLNDAGVEFMPVPEWSQWNGWLTCILFDDSNRRDRVMKALGDVEIESRPLWKPMHGQPIFESATAYTNGVSNDLFSRGLCIPSGADLTDEHRIEIASIVGNER